MRKPSVARLRKFWRVMSVRGFSIRSRILLNHILVLMIPVIVIYMFVSGDVAKDKTEAALRLIRMVNRQAVEKLDGYLTHLDELSKQPLYESSSNVTSVITRDPDFLQILRDSNRPPSSRRQDPVPDEESARMQFRSSGSIGITLEETSMVRRVLHRVLTFNTSIYSVILTNRTGDRRDWIMTSNALYEEFDPSAEPWFARAIEANGSSVVTGCLPLKDLVYRTSDGPYFFSVSRAIKDTGSTELLGVISIYTSVEYLKDICDSIRAAVGERILITDESGSIVYDTEEANILKSARDADTGLSGLDLSEANGAVRSVSLGGRRYLVETAESEVSRWKLVRLLPEEYISSSVRDIRNRFFLLVLVFVTLSMVLSIVITYNVTQPLKKLIHTMKIAGKGDLSIRFKVRRRDEIGQLGRNFNVMMNRIDNLVNIVYVSQIRKKEAELSALQTQINPHFIYNTLESVRMMAELNDDPETSKMILLLGKLLRYNIGNKNRLVTVRQEMEHLRNYVVLQNYRFRDKFELSVEIPENLYEVSIIKLVFQPIVENAIFHGLETLDRKGVILVTGALDDGGITFEVRDNGIGMTAEQLEELSRKTSDFSPGKTDRSIGLVNVNERIKLYYGTEFGIAIRSEYGQGTAVTLRLPSHEKMNSLQV